MINYSKTLSGPILKINILAGPTTPVKAACNPVVTVPQHTGRQHGSSYAEESYYKTATEKKQFQSVVCKGIHSGLSTSRKKCRGKNTGDTWDLWQKLSGVLNATHPRASILKGRRQNNTWQISRMGAEGGGRKERGFGSSELIYLQRNEYLPPACALSLLEPVQL